MTIASEPTMITALRRAVVRATRAPSVHNTQPWHFTVGPDFLELRAVPQRRLRVLDPYGRQLLLSCGCALLNARVALAEAGVLAVVRRFPDPAAPDLLARVWTREAAPEELEAMARLAPGIERRQTNRRHFAPDPVPSELLEAVIRACATEDSQAVVVKRAEDRLAVARLSQHADQIENADPAYRAELRAWTSDDPARADGVPSFAVPHVDGSAQDDVPVRDFDLRGTGGLPSDTASRMNQCMVLIGSLEDTRSAWLRAGEALERALLETTVRGYTASFLTQVIEVAHTNVRLRQELRLAMHPHVLLRIGRAAPTPMTRRLRLVDVLDELR